MNNKWYVIENVDELDTPALVVYPARVQHNIDTLKAVVGDVSRLRPHVKTHKSPQVVQRMLAAGITKFKCATIAEAEMLGMCDAPDVLLAYQPNGPKLKRFIDLVSKYPRTAYTCLVDNQTSANEISANAVGLGITIPVFIDLNVGMGRTGVEPKNAFELYRYIAGLEGIAIYGLHAYDGHIHDPDLQLRKARFQEVMNDVNRLRDVIVDEEAAKPVIIAGGSPTFPIAVTYPDIECSPGTFAYWDRGYQTAFPEQQFETAALVIGRVVSLPGVSRICIDIGHKSVSAENDITKRIYFLNAPDLKMIGQSEEHLIAEAGPDHNIKVGDVLYGLPYHICPTVALYERAYTIERGKILHEWLNTARDRKLTI